MIILELYSVQSRVFDSGISNDNYAHNWLCFFLCSDNGSYANTWFRNENEEQVLCVYVVLYTL